MYDFLFRNAVVIDGSGKQGFIADVAVAEKRICLIDEDLSYVRASRTFDASSFFLVPGFIDIHSHTDSLCFLSPQMDEKANQGITLDVAGNCGAGFFPNTEESLPVLKEYVKDIIRSDWEIPFYDYSSLKAELKRRGCGINMSFLCSHTAIRTAVMGKDSKREAGKKEIEKMCMLLEKELDSGACGFSTGLYYSPLVFSSRDELKALLNIVGRKGKLFSVHHRSEGNDFLSSLDEILSLAFETSVKTEISHFKVIGEKNQNKLCSALSLIEKYREKGLCVSFDQYPYTYGSTSLFSLLPPSVLRLSPLEIRIALSLDIQRRDIKEEMLAGTTYESIYSLVGPDRIKIKLLENNPQYENMSLTEIASERNEDALDALLDILAEETGCAIMEDETESEENLTAIMKHPLMSFGSDSLFSVNEKADHERSRSAVPHFLSLYVKEKKILSLAEAVARLSGRNADKLSLSERGYVREGYYADLVLLSRDMLSPDTVLVNGTLRKDNGVLQNTLPGMVI